LEMWEQDLDAVIQAGPMHISTYCLTFEEDTALWVRLQKGQVQRHTIEDEARFHELTWEKLSKAGYEQYEVSNFAKNGHACRHNLNTWQMQEWVGYGPSASSQLGSRRWTEPHSIDEWLAGLRDGRAKLAEEVQLTPSILAQDYLIFGLRMNAGVDLVDWESRFGESPINGWESFKTTLLEERLAKSEGKRLWLTDSGRLVADRIGEEILGLE
jgi:oxygen-independent coproporphyrinogen-3 oxidase